MSFRDQYSNFGYFDAFTADITSGTEGDENGNDIDLQGFGAAVIAMNAASLASAGDMNAADKVLFILQHGLASALGVSTFSNVPNSLLVHSTLGGYESTAEDGIFASIQSNADVLAQSGMFFVGYKGDADHRFLRVLVRNSDNASAMNLAGIAILGQPDNWPVNDPIKA